LIVVQWPPDEKVDGDVIAATKRAFNNSSRRLDFSIFLVFCGDDSNHIWKHATAPPKSEEADQPSRGLRVEFLEALKNLVDDVEAMQHPVMGVVFGRLGSACTCLVNACDHIMASRDCEFTFLRKDCEAAHVPHGAFFPVEPESVKAPVGFVDVQHEDIISLMSKCNEWRSHLGTCSPSELRSLKQGMRVSRAVDRKAFASLASLDKHITKQASSSKDARSIVAARDCSEEAPTNSDVSTLMVCNLPCRVNQHDLVSVVETLGFLPVVDFLHVPAGGRGARSSQSNFGYGFINFVSPGEAAIFKDVFEGYRFEGFASTKYVKIKPAVVQGLVKNIHHFVGRPEVRPTYIKPWFRNPPLEALENATECETQAVGTVPAWNGDILGL
jgi:hypothetical protein